MKSKSNQINQFILFLTKKCIFKQTYHLLSGLICPLKEVVGIRGGRHSAEDMYLIQTEDTYRSHFLKILFWIKEENLDKRKRKNNICIEGEPHD